MVSLLSVLLIGLTYFNINVIFHFIRVFVKDIIFADSNGDRMFLMNIYASLVMFAILMAILRVVTYVNLSMRVSRNMHKRLYNSITNTTMNFFQMNSSGRIINRFSRDIDNLDVIIPSAFYGVITVIII